MDSVHFLDLEIEVISFSNLEGFISFNLVLKRKRAEGGGGGDLIEVSKAKGGGQGGGG